MNLTRHNFEEYFLLYLDQELEPADREVVEAFVREHADLGPELDALRKTYLEPEEPLAFENKALLYRMEERPSTSAVIPLRPRWAVPAAAAVLLLLAGATWMWMQGRNDHSVKPAMALTHQGGLPAAAPTKGVPPVAATRARTIPIPRRHAGVPAAINPGSTLLVVAPSDSAGSGHDQANDLTALIPVTTQETPALSGSPDFRAAHAIATSEKNPVGVVTSVGVVSYHSLTDTDQEGDDNHILFLRQDLVLTSSVKGFFRKAGRMILRGGAQIGNDHLHPGGTEDEQ